MGRRGLGSGRRSTTRAAAVGAVLAVVIGGSVATPAWADPADVDQPYVYSPTRSTTDVPVTGGAVDVQVRVTDSGSGVTGSFDVWFTQDSASTAHVPAVLTSGDVHDGTWTATAVIPADAPGLWSLHVGAIADAAGNVRGENWYGSDGSVRSGYPKPPSTVQAAATGVGHELLLTWPAADDGGRPITSYSVRDGAGALVGSTDADHRSIVVDLGRAVTTGFWATDGTYRVISVNATGTSLPSVPSARTPAPATVPGPMQSVFVVRDGGSAAVSWSPPVDAFTSGVTAVVATAQPGGASCRSDGPGTSCRIAGLDPGAFYSFSAAAINRIGAGTPTAPTSPVLFELPPGPNGERNVTAYRAPSIPSNPGATFSADGTTAVLRWGAASTSNDEPVEYTVASFPAVGSCRTSSTSCSFAGLVPGTTYRFTVAPVSPLGGPGTVRTVDAKSTAKPGPPQALTASTEGTKATISWSEGATNGARVQRYVLVLRSSAGEERTSQAWFNERSATFTDLRPGVRWTVALAAVNAVGWSEAPTAVFTLIDPKVRPARATAPAVGSVRAKSLRARWSAVSPRTGQAVDRYQLVVLKGTRVVSRRTLPAGARSAAVKALHPSTTYRFQVRAHNRAGWGDYSKAVKVRTRRH